MIAESFNIVQGDLPGQIKNESRIRHSILAGLSFEFQYRINGYILK
ncbi:MAG: hypothetical protein LBQ22_07665 [Bacteroidales bacterium]|jgi:hypothetical protein|nr:hypothetical protein [Bacteroidales bacterium]